MLRRLYHRVLVIRKQNVVNPAPGAECSNQGENTLTQQFGRRAAADVLF